MMYRCISEWMVDAASKGANIEIVLPEMTFAFPLATEDWKVTSPFGVRMSPLFNVYRHHNGADISIIDGKQGMPQIVAIADGTIKDNYLSHETRGKHIIIVHDNGMETGYLHLSESFIHEFRPDGTPWRVKAGEPIGRMGATGATDGAHLHFWMKFEGEYLNPMLYLNQVLPEWDADVIIGLTDKGRGPALNRENQFLEGTWEMF